MKDIPYSHQAITKPPFTEEMSVHALAKMSRACSLLSLSNVYSAVYYTPAHVCVHLKTKARSCFLSRLLFGADVLLQHARGFVTGLLPDLEFRHPIIECRGSEAGAQRVSAVAVEVADAGPPQCPFQDPGHRGRVQGGLLHVFAP